jgi:HlyD family secretion protein
MHKRLRYVVLCLIASLAISGCSNNISQVDAGKKPVTVLVAQAEEETMPVDYSYQALLQLAEPLEISAEAAGIIEAIYIQAGQEVMAGDLLAGIKNEGALLALSTAQEKAAQLQIQEEKLQAQLKDLNADWQRQQILYNHGAISLEELESYQLRLELLQHDIKAARGELALAINQQRQAELDLNSCSITAPGNIIIHEVLVDCGQYVRIGEPLMRGGNARKLQVRIEVPRDEASSWKIGDALKINSQGQDREALISHISKVALAGTQRVNVLLYIDNNDLEWVLGEWAAVSGSTSMPGRVVVPVEAVAQGNSPYVYIIENGCLHKQAVILGTAEGSKLTVEGIEPGTMVVNGGLQQLRDGQMVDCQVKDGSQ